jgi:hypothetical protein
MYSSWWPFPSRGSSTAPASMRIYWPTASEVAFSSPRFAPTSPR